MMGHRSKRFKFFAPASLEALVPADHFYRQLGDKLDLSFVPRPSAGLLRRAGLRPRRGAARPQLARAARR
jgi:hypothetical protein